MPKRNRTVYLDIRGRWVNKRGGISKASSKHNTQGEAIKAAREILRRHGGELTVKTADGKIQSRETVGRAARSQPRDGAS
jgi:Uncharacterized protein conserved in bacteria (DUF2188)